MSTPSATPALGYLHRAIAAKKAAAAKIAAEVQQLEQALAIITQASGAPSAAPAAKPAPAAVPGPKVNKAAIILSVVKAQKKKPFTVADIYAGIAKLKNAPSLERSYLNSQIWKLGQAKIVKTVKTGGEGLPNTYVYTGK